MANIQHETESKAWVVIENGKRGGNVLGLGEAEGKAGFGRRLSLVSTQ